MLRYNLTILCALYLVHFAVGGYVLFHDCGSEFELDDVTIDGCNLNECVLERGKDVNVTFLVRATASASNLHSEVILRQMTIEYEQLVTPVNMCSNSVDCPVSDGGYELYFTATLQINETNAPLPNNELTWKVNEIDNFGNVRQMLICMIVNVRLT